MLNDIGRGMGARDVGCVRVCACWPPTSLNIETACNTGIFESSTETKHKPEELMVDACGKYPGESSSASCAYEPNEE